MMLEQQRASQAFKDVEEIKKQDKSLQDEYSTLALKFAAMIRSAGLCQALHFVKAKAAKKKEQKKPSAHATFLDHLAGQLQRVDKSIKAIPDKEHSIGDALCERARETKNLAEYLRLTREALAVAHWYSRLVRAEFGDESIKGSPR